MFNRRKSFLLALAAVLSIGVFRIRGSETSKDAETRTAVAVGLRLAARAGACAANLKDGGVLITGGRGQNGVLGSSETFSAKHGSKEAAPMILPRAGHACSALSDGRVLVAGGSVAGGATSSAEIFNPATGAWSLISGMTVARSGVAAVAIGNRVLIAGGESNGNATATLEIFDPASNSFSQASSLLSSPRREHATIALKDGRVLIAGGSDGKNALNSIDVFDPASGLVSPLGRSLSVPRAGLGAVMLLDGRIFFSGGSDGRQEFASTEIYDPKTGTLVPAATMGAARSGHLAILVPNNNSVLVIGGNARGGVVASVELYIPWWNAYKSLGLLNPKTVSEIGLSKDTDALRAAAADITRAADESGPALPTLFTDQPDYSPGQTAIIAGGGWPANTEVALELVREPDAMNLNPSTWKTTTDVDGNLSTTYLVQQGDRNTTLTLTATVAATQDTAQIQTAVTFTDGVKVGTVTVGSQSGTPAFGSAGSATYNVTVTRASGNNFTADLSITTTLPAGATALFNPNSLTFTSSDNSKTSTLTITTNASTPAGSAAFTVQAFNSTNDYATGNGTLAISKANQTVSFGALAAKVYGDAPFAVSATATSGLGVTFTALGSCTVSSSTVTITGAGSCTITAQQVGNSSYNAAPDVPQSFTVTQKLLTASATVSDKTYDGGTLATIVNRSLGGIIGGDDVTLTGGSATFANKNVGTAKTVSVTGLSLSGTKAANYTLSSTSTTATANITALALTGSITADNKVYDKTTAATIASRSLTGVLSPDAVSLTGGTASFADKNAGVGKTVTATGLSLTGADAANYTTNTTATATADITALQLTVASVTANNKVYNGNTTALTSGGILTGVLSPDAVTLTMGAATFSDKNAGTGKTVTVTGLALSGADAANYSLGSTTKTTIADITPLAITGSVTVSSKVYDGNTSATLATRSLAGVLSGDAVNLAGGTATFMDKNVGNGKTVNVTALSLAGDDAGNYTANSTATATANITPLAITSSITAASKAYDGNTSATVVTRSLTGFISTDTVSLVGGTATFDDKNAGNGKTVTATSLSLSGTDAGNYTVGTTATTTANITPASLTAASITANSKVYDGTASATISNSALSGVISPDVVTLTIGSAAFSDKTAANSKTVTAGGLGLGGADAGNYALTTTTITALANITPLPITGSVTVNSKQYDGNNNATIASRSLTGIISGDTVNLVNGTATFPDKNIGTSKPVSVTALSLSGTDAGNYTVNATASATANITALAITGSVTAADKTYDGNATATILTRTLTGVLSPDVVTLSGGTATFNDKNAGTGKTVTANGLSLSGGDAGNYAVNPIATTAANITPLGVTGSITVQSKVYDGTTAATIATRALTGTISGDIVSYTGGTASFADKNAGTSKPVNATGLGLSGTDAGNYTVNTTAAATADITPLSVSPVVTVSNKTYDATTSASISGRSLLGAVSGDDVILAGGTANFVNKSVGTGKTVNISGLSLGGTAAGNYTLASSSASSTANITQLALTGSITAQSKTYDSTTGATILTRNLSGVLGSDSVTYEGGTATFDNKNAGMGKTVTANGLSLSGGDAGNYTVNPAATTTANITPLGVTGSITVQSKVYDGTTAATIATRALAGTITGDSVMYSGGTASFSDKNAGPGKTVTATGLGLSGADAGNYTVNTTAAATADITPLSVSPVVTVSNKTYDATTSASITVRSLLGAVSVDEVTLAGGTANFVDKSVGAGKTVNISGLSLGGTAAGNYTLASSSASSTANITALALTGSITAQSKTYDSTTGATILTRNLAGVLGSDSVTYEGGTATFDNKNAGMGKTVTANGLSLSGGDAGNYTVNPAATTTANITQLGVTGSITVQSKVYDGTTAATIATRTLAGTISGDIVSYTGGTASFADKNAGTGKPVNATGLGLSGTDAGNYTVNTTAAATADITPLSVSPVVTVASKTYDGNASAPNITSRLLQTSIGGDNVSLTGGTATFADKNVGDGKTVTVSGLTLLGNMASNYALTSSSATTSANITALAITGGITAQSRVYDGTTSATIVNLTLSGVLSNDAVSYVGGTATFADKKVGPNKTVTATGLSLSGNDAGNYTVNTTASTTANITAKPITVGSISAQNKIYDGNAIATLTNSTLTGVISGDTVNLVIGSVLFNDKHIGVGKTVTGGSLGLSGIDAGNYSLATSSVTTTATITALAITGSVTINNKVYDGTTTATVASRSLTGAIPADIVTLTGGLSAFADKNIGTNKPVNVTGLSLTGTDAGNYTINTTASATANITPLALTGSITAGHKVYDGSPAATIVSRTLGGVIGQEAVVLTGGTASFNNKHVGTGKPVTAINLQLSGIDAGNYTVNSTASTTANITAKPITVGAITAQNKAYDGNAVATISSYTLNGVVSGDGVTLTIGSASFDTANVGNGKPVGASSLSLSGNDAANYNLTTTAISTTANITQAATNSAVVLSSGSVQYSDPVNFMATLSSSVSGYPLATSVTFTAGSQTIGTVVFPSGAGAAQIAAPVTLPSGSYTVTATFNGINPNFQVPVTLTTPITVIKEQAHSAYTGALFASTSSATSSTATVTLSATIKDITAVLPATDPSAGDISKATVTFVNRDASDAVLCSAPVGLVTSSDTKTGTATCNWSASIGASDSQSFTVGVIVGGNYYAYNGSDDDGIVTVSKPLDNFITGGGYLKLSNSSGLKAGDANTNNNFGFNVKYNKSGTNLQGNINTLIRRMESDHILHVYQIKGNSMTSLSVQPGNGGTPGKATFNGKANIQDITNPSAPVSLDGNATLQVTITDTGSGSTDGIGLTVWNKSGGMWFSSNWNSTTTVEQTLGGGNLSVK